MWREAVHLPARAWGTLKPHGSQQHLLPRLGWGCGSCGVRGARSWVRREAGERQPQRQSEASTAPLVHQFAAPLGGGECRVPPCCDPGFWAAWLGFQAPPPATCPSREQQLEPPAGGGPAAGAMMMALSRGGKAGCQQARRPAAEELRPENGQGPPGQRWGSEPGPRDPSQSQAVASNLQPAHVTVVTSPTEPRSPGCPGEW